MLLCRFVRFKNFSEFQLWLFQIMLPLLPIECFQCSQDWDDIQYHQDLIVTCILPSMEIQPTQLWNISSKVNDRFRNALKFNFAPVNTCWLICEKYYPWLWMSVIMSLRAIPFSIIIFEISLTQSFNSSSINHFSICSISFSLGLPVTYFKNYFFFINENCHQFNFWTSVAVL